MKTKYAKELKVAIQAAKAAGKLLMKTFNKQVHKQHMKGEMDFYLQADKDAEDLIIKIIKKSFPDHAILAEESGRSGNSDYTWIIDPLDGTHNYAYGIPLFGSSIALQHKGKIVVGAISLPYLKELYYAENGKGAFMNGKKISVRDNAGRFINVGGTHRFRDKVVSENLQKIIETYHPRLRFLGSAVVSATYVATGRIAAYVTFFINPWDIAAGGLIIEEAGGKITDIHGKKWNPHMPHLVFSNGKIHDEILKALE